MFRQDTRRGFNGARSALLLICDAVESYYQSLHGGFGLWLLEMAVEVGGLRGAVRAVRSAGAVGVLLDQYVCTLWKANERGDKVIVLQYCTYSRFSESIDMYEDGFWSAWIAMAFSCMGWE